MEKEVEKEVYTITMHSKYNFKENININNLSKQECTTVLNAFEKGEPIIVNLPITKDKISSCVRTKNFSWVQIKLQK